MIDKIKAQAMHYWTDHKEDGDREDELLLHRFTYSNDDIVSSFWWTYTMIDKFFYNFFSKLDIAISFLETYSIKLTEWCWHSRVKILKRKRK
jgi:hypothetical protein